MENFFGRFLPYWLTLTSGESIKIYFEKKDNCIQSGPMPSGNLSKVKLWVDYIYLERQENLNFAQRPIEYLVEVNQHLERNLISSGIKNIALPFTLPCKELLWVVRNKKPLGDKLLRLKLGVF